MINVFITGGTGFLGRALLRYVLQNGLFGKKYNFHVLTRDVSKFINMYKEFKDEVGLNFIEGNINNPQTINFPSKIDFFIHAAGDAKFGPNDDSLNHYLDATTSTINALELSVENNINRFILLSSGAVYGQQLLIDGLTEKSSLNLSTSRHDQAYAFGKLSAEHLCTLYSQKYKIETIVCRCFSFIGEDVPLDAHFAIGNFIRDAIWSNEIIVRGDGNAIRSFMDQNDFAVWLLAIMLRGRPNTIYNVGSDDHVTIKELATLTQEIISPEKSVRIEGTLNKHFNNSRHIYVPDITKARVELNLYFSIGLRESIRKTANLIIKRNRDERFTIRS